MAVPDKSTGLKIAVGAFAMLSVVLTIALYFLYNAHDSVKWRLDSALHENKHLRNSQRLLQAKYDELQTKMSRPPDSGPK
jgi:hypothetical protein